MAVTAYFFDKFYLHLFAGEVDIEAVEIKCMMTTVSFVPIQATHEFRSSVTNEVAGTAYTAGGKIVTSVAATLASHVIKIDADDVEWATSTIPNARIGVLYVNTGSSATDVLIGFVDFGEDLSSVGVAFKIIWDATFGVMSHTIGSPT